MKTIDFNFVKRNMPHRPDDAHKGTMGTLMNITGSWGYTGAAILCAKAALRSGVGLLYQILPESVYPIFASSVYEAVCVPVSDSADKTVSSSSVYYIQTLLEKASAAVIGCGLKNTDDTRAVVDAVIKSCTSPLVVDADGINALASHIDILERAKTELILTPHPKEFSRLTELDTAYIVENRVKAAEDFSKKYPNVTLVLKGHRTLIAKNGEIYENPTGNSGMAKGGAGDVLSGIIGSLLAQGVSPFKAAVMGVYLHGRAGDIAAERLTKTAMLPSDIIDCLPEAYTELRTKD
ncbi:MAG: NAD(P)H-hydrate dehydratase [Ruminococcus sp.]|nr:NAD(P)H-hydrate dehydratase [Ruminococcus sp.]